MDDFKLEDWLPMEPGMGPPLPRFLGLTWPWYKEEAPPGATIGIEIFNSQGLPVEGHSPKILTEGESYTVRVTVTNTSTKAGIPWEADLDVGVMATTTYHTLISATRDTYHFAAGQALALDYPMAVPLGSGEETGSVWARVFDPAGAVLAEADEPITIETVEVIYGATVVIA